MDKTTQKLIHYDFKNIFIFKLQYLGSVNNFPPFINHTIYCISTLIFFNDHVSSRHSPGINLRQFPSIHSSHNPLLAPFKNSLMTPSLSCVHIFSLPPDSERCLWPSKYFDQVPICLSSEDLFNFWYKFFLSFPRG